MDGIIGRHKVADPLGAAAASYGITRKTLVRHVGRLERELGLQIVHRSPMAPHAITGYTVDGDMIAATIAEVRWSCDSRSR
ncbi:hypothetical protein B0I31_10936 [Saccharothrix carnea]|uniref:Uncharacterized protein n=1 Tax=Saccharothrix carnea TaxID=1280637 RepID=A0A2P8I452_SACCR|nr:LysR family transcriptional regulator [Saccharothrix carnea]PSL53246.1 hypothetical protein B0I31_10936 [Saccharothrix carnea]